MIKSLHIMIASFFLLLVALVCYKSAKAQEVVPRSPVNVWLAAEFANSNNARTSVYVVETPGACVYVLKNSVYTYGGVAAISKKDLPIGKGC